MANETTPDATRESLELLFHVSRELATALDLRTVLQRILFLSVRNVHAERGSIVVLDNRGQPVEAAIVFGDRIISHTIQQLRETVNRGLAGWVVRNQEKVLVADTSKEARWLRRPDDAQDQSGAKSAICVPLLSQERLVGVLTIVHPQPNFFNEGHLALIGAIADQAGIAVMNGRLYADSQHQARVMTALAESAVIMNTSLQLDQVLQRILEQVAAALRVETALLALIDPAKNALVFRAANNKAAQVVIGHSIPLGQGIAGKVAQDGHGVIVPDASRGGVLPLPGLEMRSFVSAPVHAQGKIIGVLEAVNPLGGALDTDALLVLSGIGSLAGTAIHNAQLYEQMQAAHRRYHELFDDSIDPILITDWDGKIQEANRQAEEKTGFNRQTLQAMNIGQLHSIQKEKTGPQFENLLGNETVSYESILQANEPTRQLPVEVHVREFDMDGGNYLQWILRDISERKELDALREDMIAMVYHDLRSPLANVVSSLDVMQTLLPAEGSAALGGVLKIAVRATGRIQRLIDSLLDINRIESGQPLTNQAQVDLHRLLEESAEAVRPSIDTKQQTLEIKLPEELPEPVIDEDMIRRVVINLLENAAKYTPSGGKVEVGAALDDAIIRVWVADSGPGISPQNQEAIFDKFTRLRPEGGPKGLGLGLAFCRLAVEAHGGRIWVESHLGEGSRFLFTLPVKG